MSAAPQSGIVVVRCSGEFDLAGVQEFEIALDTVLQRAAPATKIEVDARDVTFCDSSAARAIERAAARSAAERHHFRLRPSRAVARVVALIDSLRRRQTP